MSTIPSSPPADKTKAFAALCWARATLWRAGRLKRGDDDWLGHAVDPLQAWAEANGLIDLIGQDEVQRIMADAFGEVRKGGDDA